MKARRGMNTAFERRFSAQKIKSRFTKERGTKSSPRRVTIQAWAGLTTMVRYDRMRRPATISINTRDDNPKKQFLAISFLSEIPSVKSTPLLPVPDQHEAEYKTAKVSEMRNAATCSGNAGHKFDCSEDKHKPLGFH